MPTKPTGQCPRLHARVTPCLHPVLGRPPLLDGATVGWRAATSWVQGRSRRAFGCVATWPGGVRYHPQRAGSLARWECVRCVAGGGVHCFCRVRGQAGAPSSAVPSTEKVESKAASGTAHGLAKLCHAHGQLCNSSLRARQPALRRPAQPERGGGGTPAAIFSAQLGRQAAGGGGF